MSFIDKSAHNFKKSDSIKRKLVPLLSEATAVFGGQGTFTGRAGFTVDTLFAGPFHPEYGEIDRIHKDNLRIRKQNSGEEGFGGGPPVGGYFDTSAIEDVLGAYDELQAKIDADNEYLEKTHVEPETEWKSTGWEYEYEEEPEYSGEDYINTSEKNWKLIDDLIKYNNKPTYAGKNFINTSEQNWKIIEGI